ncbi:hypothetical protein VCHA30O60_50104 [Vibrio chagasii]|nr:hypothetical protein VCHA30O60_50104 [Vibrio chagasii]
MLAVLILYMGEEIKESQTQAAKHSQAFYAQLKADGTRVVEFNCPYCLGVNQAQSNHSAIDWHGLSECISCSNVFNKLSHANHGPVKASKLD